MPLNSAPRKASTIAFAISGPTTKAPKAMIWEPLFSRVCPAVNGSEQTAARMPRTLFAEIEMPMPVPQISTPRSTCPSRMAWATLRA